MQILLVVLVQKLSTPFKRPLDIFTSLMNEGLRIWLDIDPGGKKTRIWNIVLNGVKKIRSNLGLIKYLKQINKQISPNMKLSTSSELPFNIRTMRITKNQNPCKIYLIYLFLLP